MEKFASIRVNITPEEGGVKFSLVDTNVAKVLGGVFCKELEDEILGNLEKAIPLLQGPAVTLKMRLEFTVMVEGAAEHSKNWKHLNLDSP